MRPSCLAALLLVLAAACCAKRYHDGGALHFDKNTNWRSSTKSVEEGKDPTYWINGAQQRLKQQLHTERILGKAKNVIVFLGDGMSFPTLAATRLYVGQKKGKSGEEEVLSFEKFPFTGLSKTYCVDAQVADSACTATAYLCGVKNNYATIGVTAAVTWKDCEAQRNVSNHVSSILQWAQDAGKATGIVTTTRVTHATPAGAYAHVANRDWESDANVAVDGADPDLCDDIAEQLVRSSPGRNFEVILGGGRSYFRPTTMVDEEGSKGSRLDGTDLVAEWLNDKACSGASARFVWDRNGLMDTDIADTDYLLGLFDASHMAYHLDANNLTEPTLPEMTMAAIAMLKKNPKGFFLFVEGGRIDTAHHDNQAHKALDEAEQLHEAVLLAQRLTRTTDTLIVVTADHAHAMTYNGYPARGNPVFGIAGVSDVDRLPYTTLSYASGPGYKQPQKKRNCTRYDVSSDNIRDKEYVFPAAVPVLSAAHGGEDVAVFAIGPWAHLFSGVYEQNVIPYFMGFSSCLGSGLTACNNHHFAKGD